MSYADDEACCESHAAGECHPDNASWVRRTLAGSGKRAVAGDT